MLPCCRRRDADDYFIISPLPRRRQDAADFIDLLR